MLTFVLRVTVGLSLCWGAACKSQQPNAGSVKSAEVMKQVFAETSKPHLQKNLDYFWAQSNTSLSYAIQVDSGKKGPHLVFSVSVHGSEPAGTDAAVQILTHIKENKIPLNHGKLTFILGNPEAYGKGLRFIDENMNRAFIETPRNNIEGNRAKVVREFLRQQKDLTAMIDLHSVSAGDFQAVVYLKGTPGFELAKLLSPLPHYFEIGRAQLPGAIMNEAPPEVPAFVVECGNHTSPTSKLVALHHIVNAVAHYKVLQRHQMPSAEFKTEAVNQLTIYKIFSAIKPLPGFQWLLPDVKTGTPVAKNQPFAKDNVKSHVAPIDSVIAMPDVNPKAGDLDAGFLATVETLKIR